MTFQSITEADLAIEALHDIFFLPGATAKLQIKWADGEARKLGLNHVSLEHANKLLVANIPYSISKSEFKKIFSKFGIIRICEMIKYDHDKDKKFCFLKYNTKE